MQQNEMSRDLGDLMVYIHERYVFTNMQYPHADLTSPERTQLFAMQHVLLHLQKSLGKIATQLESRDHGESIDSEELKTATTKILVNTLTLAHTLEVDADELVSQIPTVLKSV